MCTESLSRQRGFTLAELLLLIVVFSIGLAGILLAINTATAHSADPMVRKQAMTIAESMMEEVLLMPYAQGGWSGLSTQANRSHFDDARDYDGFRNNGIYRIEDGTLIDGLQNYNVAVAVVSATLADVSGLAVTVTVTGPFNTHYALTSYKFDY